jgi:hypothetical protein
LHIVWDGRRHPQQLVIAFDALRELLDPIAWALAVDDEMLGLSGLPLSER